MNALLPFYKQHVEEAILPFWIKAQDHKNGGVYTCFNNAGDQLISKDKYTWSQGRFLWLWAKIAAMMADGKINGDAAEFYHQADKTARFLENNAFLANGNCAFLLTETGKKKESISGEGFDTSIYADFFVVIGLSGYAEVKKDAERFERALELYNHITDRLVAGKFRSEPYPVPEGYRPHAVPMLMLHVTQGLADAADALNHGKSKELHQLAGAYMKNIMDDFLQSDNRIVEMMPLDPSDKSSLLYRHVNPGHIIECMWFVMQTALKNGRKDYIEKASRVIIKAFELGWDSDFGGLLRFVDAKGGKPGGENKDCAYEKLVMDTWDMKLWWPHSEALYATLLAYNLTGNSRIKEIYDILHEYTFKTFPQPDPDIGEWIQIRDRRGTPLDKVAALPVKDPYHILRNLILVISLIHSQSDESNDKNSR